MRDGEGYFYVVDRKKDMYISRGRKMCYPAEIEHFLRTHEAVQEVAVIGVPERKVGGVGHGLRCAANPELYSRPKTWLAYCFGQARQL